MMIENPPPEPSMDEILASIRQIISADVKEEALSFFPQNKAEDVLDLTELLPEDFEKPQIQTRTSQSHLNGFEKWTTSTSPSQDGLGSSLKDSFEESLLSQKTLSETTQAFHLLNKVTYEKTSSVESRLKDGIGGQTVENLVREMLKPLLKEWLDAHLPSLVGGIVTQQVEKIVNQAGHKVS